ncbi:hypothetical protein F8A10_09440 [Paracoccus kondratievae]|uniref:Uncharacterized protein n=1 Tax=Paracoccus kondratievae TaxID=135740 RepID=A0AAD3RTV5_9RHOB|nr:MULTISPECIES: hypothetical protein [Paracoccus]QFQ87634.1 hypothetical protein F8A10_09440 [Paracoccus kondratievae]GLK64933.1 hypothetical protein GCM10017635_24040 [Paracoccus kondratievae]SMG24532.1 hypothetical protein SAMN02746000_01370 [Paracoccus sp. J56]
MLDAEGIAALFTREGQYLCARWGRPVAPVIFGLTDESLAVFRDATRAVLAHARHPIADTDPEMGANMLTFFVRDWDELQGIPDLDRLTGQSGLPERLKASAADQYRLFRFDADGAIRACMAFVNMGGALADAHPGQLAETLAVRAMLSFTRDVVPTPELASLIRAAYDPVMPAVATDPSHALRLAARMDREG